MIDYPETVKSVLKYRPEKLETDIKTSDFYLIPSNKFAAQVGSQRYQTYADKHCSF